MAKASLRSVSVDVLAVLFLDFADICYCVVKKFVSNIQVVWTHASLQCYLSLTFFAVTIVDNVT
jgi:hypothetical protein